MTLTFQKASRRQAKARICIAGPSGSGKTFTALQIARGIVGPEGRIALIDTEKGSASLYADEFEFDVLELAPPFAPETYIAAIEAAEQGGYDVVVIDSMSHEWNGSGGILQIVDEITARKKGGGRDAWKDATPRHTRFLETIVRSSCHVVATVRSKTAYEWTGAEVKKLGLEPIQRDELEYEFTIYGSLDRDHRLDIQKSRMRGLQDAMIHKPDHTLGEKIAQWLSSAEAQVQVDRPVWLGELLSQFAEPHVLDTAQVIAPEGVVITKPEHLYKAPPEFQVALRDALEKDMGTAEPSAPSVGHSAETGSGGNDLPAEGAGAPSSAAHGEGESAEGDAQAEPAPRPVRSDAESSDGGGQPDTSPVSTVDDDLGPAEEFARIAAKAKDNRIFKEPASALLVQVAEDKNAREHGSTFDYDKDGPTFPLEVLHEWERRIDAAIAARDAENAKQEALSP